jgi:hypothetical protein
MTRVPKTYIGPDFNPGGAFWCETHNKSPGNIDGKGRLECTKNRSKSRGRCHAMAVRGTNACPLHSGIRKDVARVKGEAAITAWSAVGKHTKLDAGMAVLGVLQMTWLRLHAYGELLRRQVALEREQASNLANTSAPDASGLVGFRYGAAGKEGTIFAQSEDIRALVLLEAAERDRVVKYAKTAHDMGISNRLTSLAERWGDVVATRVTVMLAALDLTPEQESRVPELVQMHLGQIDVGDIQNGEDKT